LAWIPYCLLGVLLIIVGLFSMEIFRRKILIGGEGITQISPWGPSTFIHWGEISQAQWRGLSQEVEIRSNEGKSIRVSRLLSGLGALTAAAESHGTRPEILQAF